MMRQIQLRNTPVLEFVQDEKFKKTLRTYQLIDQAMAEIRAKADRQAHRPSGSDAHQNGSPTDPTGREQGSAG